ncbi:hypothetical protein PPL_01621 [Heterostelium album PN500]|uniref:Ankyrin repeat protein n=1 Tax=Heterostelium pallidum (strain ATCC 26659 / Pp 5 / PN500) TaxID=670386 RepID=D3B007_HETP5|nr:hypothetical protein PPL_01621 [Heterostelium album PN500]EFA84631.1 hypothetical protein PPL_01621 [Heterostelium album PN500]|eukprot:XP_020436744.1 hypothetical protein PPL_01621 [Heterostelium album PN500]
MTDNKINLFFKIINNTYLFNLICQFIHSKHFKYYCKANSKYIEYAGYLVKNGLFDKMNLEYRINTVFGWSTLSLEYLVSQHRNEVGLIEKLIDRYVDPKRPLPINNIVLSSAIKHATKDFSLVKLLLHRFTNVIDTNTYAAAAEHGRTEIIQYMMIEFREIPKIGKNAVIAACRHGQLQTLIFLDQYEKKLFTHLPSDNVVKFNVEALNAAASGGSLECVNYLLENRTEGCTHGALDGALMIGRLDIVEAIRQRFPQLECSNNAIKGAKDVKLEILKYILDNKLLSKIEISNWTFIEHCATSLEVLSYLVIDQKIPCTHVSHRMLECCGLSLVEFLVENKILKKSSSMRTYIGTTANFAEQNGNLDIIKYLDSVKLLEHQRLAYCQYPQIVEYALNKSKKSFPKVMPAPNSVTKESRDGIFELVTLLAKHGITFNPIQSLAYIAEVSLEMFIFFEKNYKLEKLPDYAKRATNVGLVDLVKYLHRNGYPIDKGSVTQAIIRNHFDVLKYLVESVNLVYGSDLIESSIKSKNFRIVEYLANKFPEINPNIRIVQELIKANSLEITEFIVERYIKLDRVEHQPDERIILSVYSELDYDVFLCLCKHASHLFDICPNTIYLFFHNGGLDFLSVLFSTFKEIDWTLGLLLQVRSLEVLSLIMANVKISKQWKAEMIDKADSHGNYEISKYLSKSMN